MKTPRYNKDALAAAIGHIAVLEDEFAAQREDLDDARERIAHLESQIRFLEERLASLTRPRALLTTEETAEMLGVHIETLRKWRKERPTPRIPFITYEGGDVRYRTEEIERYLNSRERGAKPALRAAQESVLRTARM